MNPTRTSRLLAAMVREEWRMHSRLFAGRRFAAFPVFLAVLVGGTAAVLVWSGRQVATVTAGMHALAFVFGLHTGSIGLVGRDAVRNLLGDLTLLVFSARTLPVSRRHLFAVFLAKDLGYYAVLFLLPMSIGLGPILLQTPGTAPAAAAGSVLLLWVTVSATFGLGIGTTLAILGLRSRRGVGLLALGVVAGTIALAWTSGTDLLAYAPYGVYQDPTVPRILGSIGLLAALFAVAGLTFDLSEGATTRSAGPAFRRWNDRIGDPLATKTLLDVHRSAGGFGKVVFSAGILLAVTAALVDLAGQITGVFPSVGISFGAILGLTGFTTYNWLTQFDDVDAYRHHPVTVASVFRAKYRAFLLLGPAVGLVFYLVGWGWLGGPVAEGLIGGVLLVGVATYVFGVTVALTGLSPNEFLFDTLLFAAFGVAIIVPLVPILIVGFALAPVDGPLLLALAIIGFLLAGIGVLLYRRSLPKWTAHHRTS